MWFRGLLALALLWASAASAQQIDAGQVWGNETGATRPPHGVLISPLLDQNFASETTNCLVVRGASVYDCKLAFAGTYTWSGTNVFTGTAAPASAAGQTAVMGTLAAAPTLTNTGQALFYNTTVNGAVLQGDGSGSDVSIMNRNGNTALALATGTINFATFRIVAGRGVYRTDRFRYRRGCRQCHHADR